MKESNKKYEYVIGIDFGHGETSAAICPLQWEQKNVDLLDPVKDLEMGGNKKVIPSAITIIDENDAKIGESAFNTEVLKKAEVHVCFKQAPKDINGEAEKIMMRFMKEVYNSIRSTNTGILCNGNHLVYIATPSGWDKATQQLYFKMAEKAGLPIKGVTKESRAAFVRAQQDTTSGIGRNISKGAIVFDMGSSTLDFTYMNESLPHLIDHGYDCGASKVEKLIFAERESDCEAIKLFERKYPELTDFLLFEARKVKEQVYSDPSLKVKKTINFDDIIDDEDLKEERIRMSFQPGELDQMLEAKGYLSTIEQAMIDFKQNHIPGQRIYGVFLTGGASRMDFIKGLVSKCWGVTEDKIYRDQDPSLTISQGVAEVARMDLRTEGMDEGLAEKIDGILRNKDIYENFVGLFGYELWDKITDVMADEFNDFKDSSTDRSVNNLKWTINEKVNKAITSISEQAPTFLQQAVDESFKDIQEQVENIIKHYSRQGENNSNLPSEKIEVPQISGIKLDDVMTDISRTIETSSSVWSGALTGAAWGGLGAAVLFGGPLGWMIGLGALAAKLLFGKTDEEKQKEAMAKKLSMDERIAVYNNFAEKWDSVQNDVKDAILNSLNSDKSLNESIEKLSVQVVESYKNNLRSVRILID